MLLEGAWVRERQSAFRLMVIPCSFVFQAIDYAKCSTPTHRKCIQRTIMQNSLYTWTLTLLTKVISFKLEIS